jgi:hypothetical protein
MMVKRPFQKHNHPEEDAMAAITLDHAFVRKHAAKIQGVLSCFDRVIFRGYLPFCDPAGMAGFLSQQGVLLKDFKNYAPQIAERLKEHVGTVVAAAGGTFRFLPKKERMEAAARELVRQRGLREGIVCGFSCLETCSTFRLQYGEGRPQLRKDYRRCTVLYVFVLHPLLGLIHVKLHTWFPLTMQVYVNGHEWLARKMDAAGLSYTQVDNAFVALGDPLGAQKCADRFIKQNWPRLLHNLAVHFNPLLRDVLKGSSYYWVVDQAEYATDVLFTDRAALASLYPRLYEHATLCLGAEDVLRFLGRKLHPCFQGEVHTHAGRRVEGVRIKHAMKANRLKMYDKVGQVLRIETVINDPGEFRVRRWRVGPDGRKELAWLPLLKGVAWLWRYADVSRMANSRYLDALAVVDDWQKTREQLDQVTRPARLGQSRKRALQPLSPADQALFFAVMGGPHRLRGFHNRDIARQLQPTRAVDAGERRRRSARVTRQIQLLRAHGLVAKIPRTRRYRVTVKGEALMSAAIYVRHKYLPTELGKAH